MRLSQFIRAHREEILVEWEAFARTCAPASGRMNIVELRDHASEMLTAIALDLETPQSAADEVEKSTGHTPLDTESGHPPTAAEEHGSGRAESGFSVEQMISEYRALRASVIRLWLGSQGELAPDQVGDLTRFNEAIDQSLAESVMRYTEDLEESKELFLAILGHDLRSPLSAILTSSRYMLDTGELEEPHLTLTSRIASSSTRMVHLVGDLLDFTRSRLGGGIPIVRARVNMGRVVHEIVDEMRAAHPARLIELDARGALEGDWDAARITQAVANLVVNALEHGSTERPVTVSVLADEREATISVHNAGPAIERKRLAGLFNPMKGADPAGVPAGATSSGLGLGLYIAERIVAAHDGSIDVTSTDAEGTTFRIHLPKQPAAAA